MESMEGRHRTTLLVAILIGGSALVVDPGGWQVFGPSKWLLITVTTWAALAFALREQPAFHRSSMLTWLILLGWATISSVTALEPRAAVLGTPDRRLGLIALATMGAAFLAGQGVDTPRRRRLIARTMTVTSIGMGIYGLAEALGSSVELTTTTTRLGSTFGSPAYLGAALALFLPGCVGLAADSDERTGWRRAALLGAVSGVALLAGSGTRAALVGLAAALALTAGTWLPILRRHRPVAAVGAVVLILLVALTPLGERLSDLGTSDGTSRVDEWTVAARAITERPLLGAGLEGYRVMFPRVVDADYVRTYGRSTVTDRAHSGPLDLGTALGVPGIAAWFGAAIWLVRRSLAGVRLGPVVAGLAAGVTALLVQEFFLFPTLEVGVAGWAVAGVVVAATNPFGGTESRALHARTTHRTVLGAVAALVAMVALVAGGLDVAADHLAAEARRTGRPDAAGQAADLRPDSFRYPLLAADIALGKGSTDEARRYLDRSLSLAPLDPALRLANLRILGAARSPDALEIAGAAVEADPTHPELRIIQGNLFFAAGRGGEAERAWLAAEYLAPGDPSVPARLAFLYLETGADEAARRAVERLQALDPDHPDLAALQERLEGA
jgi:O-antigen ligase/Flp pilus assembly protein TadD